MKRSREFPEPVDERGEPDVVDVRPAILSDLGGVRSESPSRQLPPEVLTMTSFDASLEESDFGIPLQLMNDRG
ncbi:MAG TPA: hypothetical protein VFF40_14715 [Acidimicrobiia bacterium]|nr:hypothetical protein [Acidimicrobiia bacterium]